MVKPKRVVFAGAGHSALVALDMLAKDRPNCELTLISDSERSVYSGMVPGWIEGLYSDGAMTIPIAPVAERAGAAVHIGPIETIGDDAITITGAPPIAFDLLVLNTGSASRLPSPLASSDVIPARPIRGFIERLGPMLDTAASFAVIGGGVAGVEVAISLKARRPDAAVHVIEQDTEFLRGFPTAFIRRIESAFDQLGVATHGGVTVASVGDGSVRLSAGSIAADCTVALTGAAPPEWLSRTPFAKAADGFIAVDGAMRSTSHPHIIAAGDVATRTADPRPKAGVFAVRAGPHVARAVLALISESEPPAVRLQRHALVLATTGQRTAVGTRNRLTLSGRWVWRLKDHLDRSFVERFQAAAP